MHGEKLVCRFESPKLLSVVIHQLVSRLQLVGKNRVSALLSVFDIGFKCVPDFHLWLASLLMSRWFERVQRQAKSDHARKPRIFVPP